MKICRSLCFLLTVGWLGSGGALYAHAPSKSRKIQVLPPENGIYLAAFPDLGDEEDKVKANRLEDFRRQAGQAPVWVYFSHNWMDGLQFPQQAVETIQKSGSVPFIRLMNRSHWDAHKPEPTYSLAKIAEGTFDKALRAWADQAKAVNGPLMVEFGTEVNDACFSWNGKWNGESAGPAVFKKAYRHIVDLCRQQGAHNITWCYHVTAESDPEAPWNTMAAYYPGDDVVDWIGVSVYGPHTPAETSQPFRSQFDGPYKALCAISPHKPLAIFEFGIHDKAKPVSKAAWTSQFFSALNEGRYPRIKAISVWHSRFKNENGGYTDMRINSSKAALKAFRQGLTASRSRVRGGGSTLRLQQEDIK